MVTDYEKQKLAISNDWIVRRNEFYDIDPFDDVPEDDKFDNIFCQEDILFITKGDFWLDLGWYGDEDLDHKDTGFMLVLCKGKNWNNCELFEQVNTKSKTEITNSINQISKLVDNGFYADKTGYKINEDDTEDRYIGQHSRYSVSRNLNELIK